MYLIGIFPLLQFPFAQIVHYSQKDRHFSLCQCFIGKDQIEDMVIVGVVRQLRENFVTDFAAHNNK